MAHVGSGMTSSQPNLNKNLNGPNSRVRGRRPGLEKTTCGPARFPPKLPRSKPSELC
jgi:hypothetical protein